MKIEVSIGEVLDKLSILSIKKQRIKDPEKLKNVVKEWDHLYSELKLHGIDTTGEEYSDLLTVNTELWEIEDALRELESKKAFDSRFVELARSVYKTNDKRAEIKKTINIKYGSQFVEEKSYRSY